MIFKRRLGLTELEQRIAPAFTVTLNNVTTFFTFTDANGDLVIVARDSTAPVGSISVTDNEAVSLATFDDIDSIVFNAACNATTTLDVRVEESAPGADGITPVGYIDFTAPAAIGSIRVEGSVIGAVGRDSISGTTLNSLILRTATSGDGSTDINDPTVGGNIVAAATRKGIVLSSGFAGSMNIAGAMTGGSQSAIDITGAINGASITIGDMTDKTIDQFDAGGDEGIDAATITITGNASQGKAGNLGGIHTDGTIINTTINIAGDFDATNLTSALDCISTDWDDNGVGTITTTTINMTGGGDIKGVIGNNEDAAGGFAFSCFQDISGLVINTNGGNIDSAISNGLFLVSGRDISGSTIDTRGVSSDGFMAGDILAARNITNFTVYAGNLYDTGPTYGADFIADAEDRLEDDHGHANFGTTDEGTITNLVINVSGNVNSFTEILNDYDGNNVVSGDLVASVIGFSPSDFAGYVISGGNLDFTLDIDGDYSGVISAFGNITLDFSAGSATGTGWLNTGYIYAGDTQHTTPANTGNLTGGILLGYLGVGTGNATDFDVRATDITASFYAENDVDSACQWHAYNDFAPVNPGAPFALATVHTYGLFDGQITADNDINFQNASFISNDFGVNGRVTADADSSGSGSVVFTDGYFVCYNDFLGEVSGVGILFTDSEIYIDNFAASGLFDADVDFVFDGDDTTHDTVDISTFSGTIIAHTGLIKFEDATMDWGTVTNTGLLDAATHVIFWDGTLRADEFAGTAIARNGDIDFSDFNALIDNSMGGSGDFSGLFDASNDILFTDSSFAVDGDFSGTWMAGNDIYFDPSHFYAYDFSGQWIAGGDIVFDPGSTFIVANYMSGTIQSGGNIEFNDTDFYIETFGPTAQFIAGVDFVFDGDGTNTFEIDFFEGNIIAQTGDIKFVDGTFDFGHFNTNGDLEATAGSIFFGDDDATDDFDNLITSVFAGTMYANNAINFTEMDLNLGIFTSDGLINASTITFDPGSFTTSHFDGTISAPNLAFDGISFDFGIMSGLIQSGVDLTFDGDKFLASVFSGTISAPSITFDGISNDDPDDFDLGLFTSTALIEATTGNLHFTNAGFNATDFLGTLSAMHGTITFDPSPVNISGDFEGLIEAGSGNLEFDASPFFVGGNMSGTIAADDGSIRFLNGSHFYVGGVMTGDINATNATMSATLEFNDSNFFIQKFDAAGRIYGDEVIFDGNGANTFRIDFFDGTISSDDGVSFRDGDFNFGQFRGTVEATDGNIFFGDDDGMVDIDSFTATIFGGTVSASVGQITFEEIYCDFGDFNSNGLISALNNVTFVQGSFDALQFNGKIEATDTAADIIFTEFPVNITGGFGAGGTFDAGQDILFTDSPFTVHGNFGGNLIAGRDIILDPSPFTADDFSGAWNADNITFDASDFTVNHTMSGSLTATSGDITFTNSDFFVERLTNTGLFDANVNFVFNGNDATHNDFRTQIFDGTIRTDTGAITFEDAVMSLGEVRANAEFDGKTGVSFTDGSLNAQKFDGNILTDSTDADVEFNTFPVNIVNNFTGSIWANRHINFTDSPLTIGGTFSGYFTADQGDITFDPSPFTANNFSGTWTADNITFTGSDFTILNMMNGAIVTDVGDISFINSDFFINKFDALGNFTAAANFVFNGGDVLPNLFTINTFSGDIVGNTGTTTFEDADMRIGRFAAGAEIRSNTGTSFTDGTFNVDYFNGLIIAGNGLVLFSDFPITTTYDVNGQIIGDSVTFDNSNFWIGANLNGAKFGSAAQIQADNGNITFVNDSDMTVFGDFEGGFLASGNIKFDDKCSLIIEGDFTGTASFVAGGAIDFDPADFEAENFDGVWNADSIVFDASNFRVLEDMTGTMQATGASGIVFQNGSLFSIGDDFSGLLHATTGLITFSGSQILVGDDFIGTFDAATNLTFTNSTFTIGDDFTASARLLAGNNITFDTGTQFTVGGDFNGDVTATSGTIKFDDGTAMLIDGDFTGDWTAGTSISFDPAAFQCHNFTGTWTAGGFDTIIFDASTFTVDNFSGSWSADTVIFQNGSVFTVNFLMDGTIASTIGNIAFTDSDAYMGSFAGNMNAATNFLFNGNDATHNTFTTGAFSGNIRANNGNVAFEDAAVDLGVFTGLIRGSQNVTFTDGSLAADPFNGTVEAVAGAITFTSFPVNVGSGGFGGMIDAVGNLTFTSSPFTVLGNFSGELESNAAIAFNTSNLSVGGNFSGMLDAGTNIVFTNSNISVLGNFSGTFDANAAGSIEVHGTGGNAVYIGGNFTGLWDAFVDIHVDGGNFTVDGEFDGTLRANNDIDPIFYFNSYGTNDGDIIADYDGNFHGDLIGTLYANGSFSSNTLIKGASVPMSFYIDGNFNGRLEATASYASVGGTGFSGIIDIGGNFAGYLRSAAGLNYFYLGGFVLDNGGGPGTFEVQIEDDATYFNVYGMGPGINKDQTVFVWADNWQTFIVRCGGIGNYVDVLAGSEPGTGYIYNLRIMGPHVDQHTAPAGGLHDTIRAHRGFPGKWEISKSRVVDKTGFRFYVELDDSGTRDGWVDIKTGKTRDGAVTVWYFDSEIFDNTITEITTIEWYRGDRPDLYITASKNIDPSFPAIGLIAGTEYPIGGLCGTFHYDYEAQRYACGFNNITTKRVDITDIYVSGSARNIFINDGSVENVTVGQTDFFGANDPHWNQPVGHLNSLIVKNGDIGHHSTPTGSVNILGNLTSKIQANNIYGEINIGGNANKLIAKNDFMADICVGGNLNRVNAMNNFYGDVEVGGNLNKLEVKNGDFYGDITVGGDFDHLCAKKASYLSNDIKVYGKLNRVSMPNAYFDGYVECSRLHHHFDVLGGTADRTLNYFYHRTEADYYYPGDGYGLLRVFDIVPSSRIK